MVWSYYILKCITLTYCQTVLKLYKLFLEGQNIFNYTFISSTVYSKR